MIGTAKDTPFAFAKVTQTLRTPANIAYSDLFNQAEGIVGTCVRRW